MKYLAATLAVLAAALASPHSASAGASASAPSKYSQAAQGSRQHADRQIYPITEYSSSTRHPSPKH